MFQPLQSHSSALHDYFDQTSAPQIVYPSLQPQPQLLQATQWSYHAQPAPEYMLQVPNVGQIGAAHLHPPHTTYQNLPMAVQSLAHLQPAQLAARAQELSKRETQEMAKFYDMNR
eukprot:gene18288-24746_t